MNQLVNKLIMMISLIFQNKIFFFYYFTGNDKLFNDFIIETIIVLVVPY
jgi:hypothetical protein